MKQVLSDKYNVAWFKLADCIARGEKERALGVYRLLAHSFDDPALSCQLHADILLSFQDPKAALAKYNEAAALYQENNRLLEAAAVYEHLVTLDPDNPVYRTQLIDLYQQLHISSKVQDYVSAIVEHMLQNGDWIKAIEMVRQYDSVGDAEYAARLHETVVFALVTIDDVLPDTRAMHAQKVVTAWLESGNRKALDIFLKKLKEVDEKLHCQVTAFKESKA